jgi:hypothetical protein
MNSDAIIGLSVLLCFIASIIRPNMGVVYWARWGKNAARDGTPELQGGRDDVKRGFGSDSTNADDGSGVW